MKKSIVVKGVCWGVVGGGVHWLLYFMDKIYQYDFLFKIILLFEPFAPNLGILSEGKQGLSLLWLGVLQTGVNGVYYLTLGVIFHFGLQKKSAVIAAISVCILLITWVIMLKFWGYTT